MKILSPAISSLARMRMWRIEAWKNNPVDAQREVLQDLVTLHNTLSLAGNITFQNYSIFVLLNKPFLCMNMMI